MEKTVKDQAEMVACLKLSIMLSKKTSTRNISNSYAHIKDKQMLWQDVGYHYISNVVKYTLEQTMLRVLRGRKYLQGLLLLKLWVYALIKISMFF